jgi:hypothetical protein
MGVRDLALGFWRYLVVVAGAGLLLAMVITAGERNIYRYARAVLQPPEPAKVSMPAACQHHDESSGSKQDKPTVCHRDVRTDKDVSAAKDGAR